MDEHIQTLQNLPFWNSQVSIKPLTGGITNFNYLIQDGDKKYVGRFAQRSNALLGLDREREVYNTEAAFPLGIGPKIFKYLPEQNLLIVEYIEGEVFTPAMTQTPHHIELLAKLLKKLHGGPAFKGTFNPFETVRGYVTEARARGSWVPDDMEDLFRELAEVEQAVGIFSTAYPCHLDLVVANIVGNGDEIRLLDWEYSASSDYRFDLAMLAERGEFTLEQEALLFTAYGITDPDLMNQIRYMKAVVSFREGAWGLLQLAISKIPFDYRDYAKTNLALFRKFTQEMMK